MIQFLGDFDINILIWIQEVIRTPFLNPVFIFITSMGNAGAVWLIISVILLILIKTRKIGIMSILALITSVLINNVILKNLVCRTRPYEVIDNLKLLVAEAHDYSFPSGHTGSSFASACILYKELSRKYGIAALILAFLIGLSRLYIGIHYPSDVLAGAVIGIIIAVVISKLFSIWKTDDKKSSINN